MKNMTMPIPEVRVGEPVRCEGITMFLLFADNTSRLDYILSHEAISTGTVVVREVSEAGEVPEVAVTNNGGLPVLILEGTELRGAKQNRMVTTTVLVGRNSRVRIPVSCVEQRRWWYDSRQFKPGSHCPPSLRHCLKRMAGGGHSRPSHQTALWDEISRRHRAMAVSSTTEDLSAVIETHRERIQSVQEQLPYPPSASGIAIALGGRIVAIDLLDKPETLEKVWDRLVQGIALDALEVRDDGCRSSATEVKAGLYGIRELRWQQVTPVGLGEAYRASGDDGTLAAALVVEGVLLHLSMSMPV
jgi:hypothetical protein